MAVRLGLDLGTNSIGWALISLGEAGEPIGVIDAGVRIFSDGRNPKDQQPLAVKRRERRQARRRLDRFGRRKQSLMKTLIEMDLLPKESDKREALKTLNVYKLRAQALDREVSRYEFGRILWHLNKKRGFQSGRKISTEDAKNKVSERIEKLKNEMKEFGSRTYGEYLWQRIRKGTTAKATVDTGIYPIRGLLKDEFEKLFFAQAKSLGLSDNHKEKLFNIIFHQRPLKEVELGPCSLFYEKQRSYKFLPSFEEYRMLSELYNISWYDEDYKSQALTSEQVEILFSENKYNRLTGKKIKKILNLSPDILFKNEKEKDIEILACVESKRFYEILGDIWERMDRQNRDQLAFAIMGPDEDLVVVKNIEKLRSSNIYSEISEIQWEELSNLKPKNVSTQAFSSDALCTILDLSLKNHQSPLKVLYELREAEGQISGANLDVLPYYGQLLKGHVVSNAHILKDIKGNDKKPAPLVDPEELQSGKIANPTVHVALRQLQKVFNEIIDRYGKPHEINVELARELKLSREAKARLEKVNRENKKRNDEADKIIKAAGLEVNAGNRERAKLWLELEGTPKQCIYTGKVIGQHALIFSDEYEVDHILPFSQTLDDSNNNKVLVHRFSNREKKNRAPAEAWSDDRLAEIQDRAFRLLPKKKFWRFQKDAMDKFREENSFIARQLTDTAYLSKIAKKYLEAIYDESGKKAVSVSAGRLTALLRGKWDLNKILNENGENRKNREDHRHHAIDAIVVGLTSRSLLKKMSDLSSRAQDPNKIGEAVPKLWDGYHRQIQDIVDKVVVSHKLDHGFQGQLLDETAYGLTDQRREPEKYERNEILRSRKMNEDTKKREYDYKVVKEDFAKLGGLNSQVVRISHKQNSLYKFYYKTETHHVAFWELTEQMYQAYCQKNGMKPKKQKMQKKRIISQCAYLFDLNKYKNNYDKYFKPHPAAKLIFKLHKGDIVKIDRGQGVELLRVAGISPADGNLTLKKLEKREEAKSKLSFTKFIERAPKLCHVSPSGVLKVK